MDSSIERQLQDLLDRKEEIGDEIAALGGPEQDTPAVRALKADRMACIKAIRLFQSGPPKPRVLRAA